MPHWPAKNHNNINRNQAVFGKEERIALFRPGFFSDQLNDIEIVGPGYAKYGPIACQDLAGQAMIM